MEHEPPDMTSVEVHGAGERICVITSLESPVLGLIFRPVRRLDEPCTSECAEPLRVGESNSAVLE